jgi:hypothetical protein
MPKELDDLVEDLSMSVEQLDDKYNPDGDGEHPIITRQQWRVAVNNEETLLGYWSWVAYQLTEEIETLKQARLTPPAKLWIRPVYIVENGVERRTSLALCTTNGPILVDEQIKQHFPPLTTGVDIKAAAVEFYGATDIEWGAALEAKT